MVSNLNMSHGKMSDFVSFPLFGFTLVIKLRNFDSESHWTFQKEPVSKLMINKNKLRTFWGWDVQTEN